MKKRIWLFHLLNDFSGSPLVLKNSVLALREHAEITVCTSKGSGFLSNLDQVTYNLIDYQWSPTKLVTLFRFFLVQWILFWKVVRNRKNIDLVYVNTLLPFGAALGAKACGIRVIYHMHEPQVSPVLLFSFLSYIAKITADKALFVSDYLRSCFPHLQERGIVLPNVLNHQFLDAITSSPIEEKNTVLMLCSFKAYKGIHDFVALAKHNATVSFELVLNSSAEEIAEFKKEHAGIDNLKIYSSTKNVHPFYARARVVLNLSHPDTWIESFGMTALEGMAYGAPCIVPEVGGISEVITKDSGFRINHDKKEDISESLQLLFQDNEVYQSYSDAAKKKSSDYEFERYKEKLLMTIFSLSQLSS